MRRTLLLTLVLWALLVAAATPAQLTETCCEGGFKPDKVCDSDLDCPGVCTGGARLGKNCSPGQCPPACLGGLDAGKKCALEGDCHGRCAGGDRDGRRCSTANATDCPGGTCANAGTCSDFGECALGTCTGICGKISDPPPPVATGLNPTPCP